MGARTGRDRIGTRRNGSKKEEKGDGKRRNGSKNWENGERN